jgi:CAAX prenyl protease-like protein
MTFFRNKLSASPIVARAAPFVVFVLLTYLQEQFNQPARYWIYLLKTLVGAWMLWEIRGAVPEMKWAFSWEAIGIGVAVFVMWVGLDRFYPHLGGGGLMWNPHSEFGDDSGRAWFFISVRIIGMTFVVPPLEEVFFRSFLYRFISQKNFLGMALNEFRPRAFWITSLLFGFEHHEWLAGILTGMAYQWIVLRKGRLGDAITAHAITNLLLGLWVIWKSAWNFF